jgi:hypothetical protein
MEIVNTKHETEFVRTMPAVVQNIISKKGDPHKVYTNLICTNIVDGEHQAVANPRNTKQVKNILSTQKQEKASSKDVIYNTFLLVYFLLVSCFWDLPRLDVHREPYLYKLNLYTLCVDHLL